MKYNTKFYFEPYIHINCQKEKVLLYNSYTNDIFTSINKDLITVLRKIEENKSAIIPISKSIIKSINQLRERFFGDYLIDDNKVAPLIIPGDLIKIVKNKEFILNPEQRSTGDIIAHNLFSLDIYLDNKREKNSKKNQCLLFNRKSELMIKDEIEDLCKSLNSYENFSTLNFHISEITNFEFLLSILPFVCKTYEINLHLGAKAIRGIDIIELNNFSNIYLYLQSKEVPLIQNLDSILSNKNSILRIFIENTQEIDTISKLSLPTRKIEFTPYFNGYNNDFFEKNVYTCIESLMEEKTTMLTIHKNSILNKNDFGNLVICSNGDTYSNLFCKSLGNLKTKNFNLILYEVYNSDNSSWFHTRNDVAECKKCIYNVLCPPISCFERLFKKNNLCSNLN